MIKNIRHPLIIILSVFLLIGNHANAQQKNKSLNYSKYPYWIEMMNNPATNYFEAIKAYDEFWATRKKPTEENEIMGQENTVTKKQTFLNKWFKSKEEKEAEETRKYTLDVKKFEHWKLKVKPYVQEDGRILSADEQLQIWQKQRQQ